MAMRVEDSLTGRGASVENPAILTAALGVRHLLRHGRHLGEHPRGFGSERRDIRHVELWHHEHVHGCLRRDVAERDHGVCLRNNRGRNLARDDSAEDAIGHSPSLGGVRTLWNAHTAPLRWLAPTEEVRVSADATRDHKEWHELLAVILLSATAVLTAWCGFESSKWGGEMSIAFSQASSNRVQASDARSAARDSFQLDAMVFAQWLAANASGEQELADYLQGVFSPELTTAFEAWDGVTKTPFGLPEYVPRGTAEAEEFTAKADAAYATALENNQRGDNYSLLTVMFALVLFLTAVSQRKGPEWARRALLTVAVVVAVTGIAILATFPVKI
jgi:hypothetical protein